MKKLVKKTFATITLLGFSACLTLIPLKEADAFTLRYTLKKPSYSYTQNTNKPVTSTPNTGSQNSNSSQTTNPGNKGSQTTPAPKEQDKGTAAGLTAQESAMLQLINQERTRAGHKPLQVDSRLVQTARAKAKDMINNNYFGHVSPTLGNPYQQMKAAGITGYTTLGGENLAGNQSVQAAHQRLMNSPGHRANILDSRYTHVGIGVVAGGPYGLMIVQHFAGK